MNLRNYVGALALLCAVGAADAETSRVLAKVVLVPGAPALRLTAYERLVGADGEEYVLACATQKELDACKAPYKILDLRGNPNEFLLIIPRSPHARARVQQLGQIVHDDGCQIVMRRAGVDEAALAAHGCELVQLNRVPLDWRTLRALGPEELSLLSPIMVGYAWTNLVATLMANVQLGAVSSLTARLTGEAPVVVGGTSYVIATRNTNAGEPIDRATQYVYEQLAALGLGVQYQAWTNGSWHGRNVHALQPGGVRSNEVVLVVAHLDNMPLAARAPGADDNASGCVGVLLIAQQLGAFQWPRTIHYVCFTGEEQGLLGSAAYANALSEAGVNVVAVFNMDMIAWDADLQPRLRLHTRTASTPQHVTDLIIAQTFTNVVAAYGLQGALYPLLALTSIPYSDHWRFWNRNYPAVLAIEDDAADFNMYYHTTNDTLAVLNLDYFTAYVKAALGTVAHLALGPPLPTHDSEGVVLLEEEFDISGALPNWQVQVVSNAGTDGVGPLGSAMIVTNVTRSAHPVSFMPHRGSHFLRFNAWNVYDGGTLRLVHATPFSTLNFPAVKVLVAWARDNEYPDRLDRLAIECSTNGSAWLTITNLTRFSAEAECWFEETCWLPSAMLGQPHVFLALTFTSAHGNDCHVDSLSVRAVPEAGVLSEVFFALFVVFVRTKTMRMVNAQQCMLC
ncbi:MAG: M28 family peptidase [bacterium]|nr:M28 family peptidase [bacterium]